MDGPSDIAQNTEPFHATLFQFATDDMVRDVHVTPSGDVAAVFVPYTIAQNTVPFQAIDLHAPVAGRVRAVQVIPSGDVAATFVDPDATAQ